MTLKENKTLNQVLSIMHFIETMDIEMIDAFLDNDKTYQVYTKYLFITKLQQAFERFAYHGDTHLFAI